MANPEGRKQPPSPGMVTKLSRSILSRFGCTSGAAGVDNFGAGGAIAASPSDSGAQRGDARQDEASTPSGAAEDAQLALFREKLAAAKTPGRSNGSGPTPGPAAVTLSASLEKLALTPGRAGEPLHAAVATGRADEVARVLEAGGADVNASWDGQDTALHTAAHSGAIDILSLLLQKGANPGAADKNGWTPLHHAALQGHVDAVETLLDAGAALDSVTEEGMTPLHCTVHLRNCVHSKESVEGMKAVIRMLVQRGADVNARDYQGWTVLHVAVQNGSMELVRELVDLGADIEARDNDGNLPVDYAPVARGLYHQNRDMQQLLKSQMASRSCSQETSGSGPYGDSSASTSHQTPESTATSRRY